MCGRYALEIPKKIKDRFKLQTRFTTLKNRYNVTPGDIMPVIVSKGNRQLEIMKWGLIPFWAKDPTIGYKMINARSETLSQKPSFRKPLVSQRCLIPASGFYEWQKLSQTKIPYYIHLKNEPIFSFAGLFDSWKDPSGKEINTYTIITTTPNSLLEKIHNRMPVIFTTSSEDLWLDPDLKDVNKLIQLLKPFSEEEMDAYPVSIKVNKPENDSKELLEKESRTLFD